MGFGGTFLQLLGGAAQGANEADVANRQRALAAAALKVKQDNDARQQRLADIDTNIKLQGLGYRPLSALIGQANQDSALGDVGAGVPGGPGMPSILGPLLAMRGAQLKQGASAPISVPTSTGDVQMALDPTQTPEAIAERKDASRQQAIDARAKDVATAAALAKQQAHEALAANIKTALDPTASDADRATAKANVLSSENGSSYESLFTPHAPVLGTPEYLQAQKDVLALTPHNIDPLSPAGIAATTKLKTAEAALPKQGGASAANAQVAQKGEQLGLAAQNAATLISVYEGRGMQGPNGLGGYAMNEKADGGALGKIGANIGLNTFSPDLSKAAAAQPLVVSAAAHSVGGARITKEQAHYFMDGFIPQGGDSAPVVKQKFGQLVDFLNAARAALPPDVAAAQDAQFAPETMATLQRYGYGKPPSKDAAAKAHQLQVIGAAPAGNPASSSAAPPPAQGSTDWRKYQQ